MKRMVFALIVVVATAALFWLYTHFIAHSGLDDLQGRKGNVARGAYLARSAGCIACHTDMENQGAPLAGGAGLETPFGTFYAPNLTMDKAHGMGNWTLQQFATALRKGVSPEGKPYYPAFPYSFYTKLSDQDVADLWTAFKTVPAVAKASEDHELSFPFNQRQGLWFWQQLFFNEGRFDLAEPKGAQYQRGAYLVESVTHCAACHTPRNLLGGLDASEAYAGSESMLEGEGKIPAITAEALAKAGWTLKDLAYALKSGIKPDGDVFGGSMGEVVRDGTAFMQEKDLEAIAYYLMNRKS